MNKKIIVLPLIFASLLVGCKPNEVKDYFVVHFINNYEDGGNFKNIVVEKNKELSRPNNPKRDGYYFTGWSLDPIEFNEFNDFDKVVENDLDLYAFWEKVEDTATLEGEAKTSYNLKKAETLKKYISWVDYPVIEATRDTKMVIAYHQPTEASYILEGQDVFSRYNNETYMESFIISEDESKTKTSTTTFTYDEKNFKKIFTDLENAENNKTTTAKFDESEVESFLGIGFYNLNLTVLDKIISSLKDNKTEEDLFFYNIDPIDLTKFDSSDSFFDFSLLYEQDLYNEEQGATWMDSKSIEGSIHFKDNKTYKSKVTTYEAIGIDGEIYQETLLTDTINYVNGDTSRSK